VSVAVAIQVVLEIVVADEIIILAVPRVDDCHAVVPVGAGHTIGHKIACPAVRAVTEPVRKLNERETCCLV
jgi:hypothetical protein